MKSTEVIQNVLSFNLNRLYSYRFWLGIFIVCLYCDLILTISPNLIKSGYSLSNCKNILSIIILTGICLAGFYVLKILIQLIISYIPIIYVNTIHDEYRDRDKIFKPTLYYYAMINDNSNLLELIKSHDLEQKRNSKDRFSNLVLLGLLTMNIFYNGIIGVLIGNYLPESNTLETFLVYGVIYSGIVLLVVINAINSIKYDDSSYIQLDNDIKEQFFPKNLP